MARLRVVIQRGSQSVPSEIVAVAYDNQDRAAEALTYLRSQEDANQLALDEAAVVVHTEAGEIETTVDERPTVDGFGRGAAGALVGGIVGMLIGPLGFVAGTAAGGALGSRSGTSHDIDEDFLRDLGDALKPGTSAIVVAAVPAELTWLSGHVPDELRGTVLRTTLSDEQLERLQARGT